MSYYDIASMARDPDMVLRLTACSAQEQPGIEPFQWVSDKVLALCASPGWAAAWNGATQVSQPGKDMSVISDAMILEAVTRLHADDAAAAEA